MMEIIRRASRTWVATILVVVLIAPLLVWSFSGLVFSPSGSSTVISVQNQNISLSAFHKALQDELGFLSQQFGFTITPEKALSAGMVDQSVIPNLVNQAILDQFSEDLKLTTSLSRVKEFIEKLPIFQGEDKKFSRDLFKERLSNAGVYEKEYIDAYRKNISRIDILGMLFSAVSPPKILIDQILQYHSENRVIDYIVLSKDDLAPIAKPSENVLKSWFEESKDNYFAPEYRRISYLFLDVNEEGKNLSMTDDELRAEYEKRKNQYYTPEIRTIDHLIFKSKEEANRSLESLKNGKTFDQLATELGKSPSDISLGSFSKEKIPDIALADPIFAVAKEGGYTDVVDGSFGSVIVRVSRIKLEKLKSFDAVKQELQKTMRFQQARQLVAEKYKKYQELFSKGDDLEEIAHKENVSVKNLPPVDISGKDMNGNEIKRSPYINQLLSRSFEKDEIIASEPISFPDGSYIWLSVQDIIPVRSKEFSEVHSQVLEDWITAKKREYLSSYAKEQVAKSQKVNSLHNTAFVLKKPLHKKEGITHHLENDKLIGSLGIDVIFSGPLGMIENFPIKDGDKQVVFKVVKSENVIPKNNEGIVLALNNYLRMDLLEEVIASLRNKYRIDIDHEAIKYSLEKYVSKQ
ncbi:SurA N-terminal domain-containing protein [Candidatus Liberibacter sp.]|uniref:SurA N-terminal domain-containing protein n=1 Tax=Candidatus Liberibacter sp. TaxID=34022 RepID=UPI0015F46D85|nr:SurA N-terminal domain-containing protein [Candidatus Liberibacter sp.]MBA5723840.1 SurA N-terminal domain-containing protein [Candidatus Liberibacter sp.]